MRYRQKTPVDEGYSWMLLTACFLVYFINMGCIKSFGILYSELLDTYKSDAGSTTSIGSIASLIQSLLTPLAINIATRYSYSGVIFAGGVVTGLGFFLSSFTSKMEYLFVTYSFLAGTGFALSFGPCITVVNFYFDKRRGLANGILVSASAVAGFVFPFLYTFLFKLYGLKNALFVLSGVMMQICVGAAIIRQPTAIKPEAEEKANTTIENQIEENTRREKRFRKVFRTVWDLILNSFVLEWHLYKSLTFVLYSTAFMFTVMSYSLNFYILPDYFHDSGYSKQHVATSFLILGVSELIAKLFLGWFIDLKILMPKTVYVISMAVYGVAQTCIPLSDSLLWFNIYAGIVGMFPGTFYSLLPLLLIDIVGLAKLPGALGLVTISTVVFGVLSYLGFGWLKDYYGTWDISWIVSGALTLSAAVLIVIDNCIQRRRLHGTDDENEISENDHVAVTSQLHIGRQNEEDKIHETVSLMEETMLPNRDLRFSGRRTTHTDGLMENLGSSQKEKNVHYPQ